MTDDGWSHIAIAAIVKTASIVVEEVDMPVILIISMSLTLYRIS